MTIPAMVQLCLQHDTIVWVHLRHLVLVKDDYWVKKCMEYEVQRPRPRERPTKTWTEVVKEDCLTRKLNKENAIEYSKWRKVKKDVR